MQPVRADLRQPGHAPSMAGFIEGLGYGIEFLHRDELEEQYGVKDVRLPATSILQNGKLKLWIESDEIGACKSVDELQTLVTKTFHQSMG